MSWFNPEYRKSRSNPHFEYHGRESWKDIDNDETETEHTIEDENIDSFYIEDDQVDSNEEESEEE